MATHTKDHRTGSLAVIVTIILLLSVLLITTDSVRANPGANPKAKDLFFGNEGAIRPGDPVPVYAKWQNTGDTNTSADIVLYVDYGSGNKAVDNVDDVFMEAGVSNTTELSWTPDREGTFNLTYKIENSTAGDDDTNNNQRMRGFDVEPSSGYADLFINMTDQDIDPVPSGDLVTILADLGNYGNITAQVNITAGLFVYPEDDDRPDEPVFHIPLKQVGRGEIKEELEFIWKADVEAGNYKFHLEIDIDDNLSQDLEATDNDTTNNKDVWAVQVTTEGGSGSDLYFVTGAVDSFDYEGDAVEGEEVTFKYSIRNQGGEDSDLDAGWNIAIYTKKKGDTQWSAEPVVVSNDIHDVARANDGNTLTGAVIWVTWEIPDDSLGEYDLKVVIDYLEELDDELARSNNEMTWRDINGANDYFTIERKLPNLLVQSIIAGGTAYANDNVTISVYLTNNGDVAATNVEIDLIVTKTSGGQPVIELDDFNVGDVLLSEDTLYNWTWKPTTKGDYKIEVYVDPRNNITEKDDSDADNKNSAFFTVEEKKPDLWLLDSGFFPSNGINGILGTNTTFWFHIQNKGIRALTENEAKETLVIITIRGIATTLKLEGYPLAVYGIANLTVPYTFQNEGSHRIDIDINPNNLVPEIDTENNDHFFTVYVDNLIDAKLTDPRVISELPQTNNPVEIAFNVTMDYLPSEEDFDVEWDVQIFKNTSLGLSYITIFNDTVTFSGGKNTIPVLLDSWVPDQTGNYTLRVNVNYIDDTENNKAEVYAYVREFSTDLQIAEVNGISVDSTAAGDRTITVVVGYAGNAPSVGNVKVWLKIFGKENKPWSGDWDKDTYFKDLGNQSVDGLIFHDQTRSLTFNWPNAVKGCYIIVAYVDHENLIHEEDELNNIFPSVSKEIGGGCESTGTGDTDDDGGGFLPGLGLSGSLLALFGAVAMLAVIRRRQ